MYIIWYCNNSFFFFRCPYYFIQWIYEEFVLFAIYFLLMYREIYFFSSACNTGVSYTPQLPYGFDNTLCWWPGENVTHLELPGNETVEVNKTQLQRWYRVDLRDESHQHSSCANETSLKFSLNISGLNISKSYCLRKPPGNKLSVRSNESYWGTNCKNLACGKFLCLYCLLVTNVQHMSHYHVCSWISFWNVGVKTIVNMLLILLFIF